MTRLLASAFAILSAGSLAHAGETVSYKAGDLPLEGYFAPAEGGKSKGAVLVIHDWDGVDSYEEKRADMLAALGYDAFALDLYGAGNRPATMDAKVAATKALYQDREAMRTRLVAGLKELHSKSDAASTVVMGYCFGGAAALELARSGLGDKVVGYVAFHGGLTTPEGQSYPSDTPPILIEHGGADTSVTMADVTSLSEQLEKAGITYQIDVYSGAPHAFTVFGSDRYRQVADEKSWKRLEEFLSERFES
ncbi:putative esterase [Hartmannibacter diazotrophicus]|uniref:Putative esterase n=1 Tax=Hartmannibacter diazotrophicus TaxID=1482074 RepID=A0A2C9D1A6_9HYPH|nr:dienelactone hydrolase family protein [Hartmannibacter diazotrophicus]SON54147.1 putative esterase [Hartmannibacter diazotrophicus]